MQAPLKQLELWYGFAWFVLAGSFGSDSSAQGRLAELVKAGFDASVIDTSDYPNFSPGLRLVVLGPFESRAAADAQRAQVSSIVKDAYVKSGW